MIADSAALHRHPDARVREARSTHASTPEQGADLWACPRCGGSLDEVDAGLGCAACGAGFPRLSGVPCLLPDAAAARDRWSSQASRYVALVEQSLAATQAQLEQFTLLPSTRGRLERLLAANRHNAESIAALCRAAGFGDAEASAGSSAGAGGLEFVAYFNHVLRDWSGDPAAEIENERTRDAVLDIVACASTERRRWGRTLVLGAGACRLAYDLAQRCRPSMTVALDASPFLLLAAERILFGPGLLLCEIPESPGDLSTACVERELRARDGAPSHLHLVLGDAMAAPFRPGSFDTVVTPWFVDIVDADLRDVLSVIFGLLAPGGAWINVGPLNYPAERPAMQRYTAAEVFDLCHRAGLPIAAHRFERADLLRSTANTRGRSERILVSVANKAAPPADAPDGVPPWLLFAHVPIPRFAGLEAAPAEPVLAYVAGLIDGKTTLRDIALRMIRDHGARPDAALDGTRALLTALYQTYGR
jgi:hypothetical protein